MSEKETEPFQFTFNGFLKVAFQGSRVTSNPGLLLVRELNERLGLETLITENLSDCRQGLNTQLRLADLLRQPVYSRLAGFEDLNDAVLVGGSDVSSHRVAEEVGPRRGADLDVALVRERAADPRRESRGADGREPGRTRAS